MVKSRWLACEVSSAVENLWIRVWAIICSMGRKEVDWATNLRVGQCILACVLSNKGGSFGWLSSCSESLSIHQCFI